MCWGWHGEAVCKIPWAFLSDWNVALTVWVWECQSMLLEEVAAMASNPFLLLPRALQLVCYWRMRMETAQTFSVEDVVNWSRLRLVFQEENSELVPITAPQQWPACCSCRTVLSLNLDYSSALLLPPSPPCNSPDSWLSRIAVEMWLLLHRNLKQALSAFAKLHSVQIWGSEHRACSIQCEWVTVAWWWLLLFHFQQIPIGISWTWSDPSS